jgi:hypothetical protein
MTGTGEEDAIRELVDFIGARLAEDRKGALEASPGFWKVENGGREVWTERRTPTLVVHFTWPQEARHIAWWSQQRVLDEVNAKGLLLELHAERFRRGGELHDAQVLRILASPYSWHPDWKEDWQW